MPGQRSPVGRRARGSWLARFAGIGLIVVLAAGGVTAYLVTQHPFANTAPLPTRVVSTQTVGLIVENARPGSAGQPMELLGRRGTLQFRPVGPAEQQSGSGQWTADLMAGDSYTFIYLPSDDCLGSAESAGGPRLVLQHCDLQASQRWRRIGSAKLVQGHSFYLYANLADRSCLAEGAQLPGAVRAASLTACATTTAANQLVAFWWDGA